jgi:hypothetical protein
VGRACSHLDSDDFGYWEETLYRKTTGEFFLHGAGGPSSKYARPCGSNGRCGGSDILPFTEEEAKRWAEENLSVDEYETLFGEVPE